MGFKAVCADVRWRFKKFQLHFNRLWRVPKGFQGFMEFKDYRGVSVSFMGISGEVLKVFQSASWTFQRITYRFHFRGSQGIFRDVSGELKGLLGIFWGSMKFSRGFKWPQPSEKHTNTLPKLSKRKLSVFSDLSTRRCPCRYFLLNLKKTNSEVCRFCGFTTEILKHLLLEHSFLFRKREGNCDRNILHPLGIW